MKSKNELSWKTFANLIVMLLYHLFQLSSQKRDIWSVAEIGILQKASLNHPSPKNREITRNRLIIHLFMF